MMLWEHISVRLSLVQCSVQLLGHYTAQCTLFPQDTTLRTDQLVYTTLHYTGHWGQPSISVIKVRSESSQRLNCVQSTYQNSYGRIQIQDSMNMGLAGALFIQGCRSINSLDLEHRSATNSGCAGLLPGTDANFTKTQQQATEHTSRFLQCQHASAHVSSTPKYSDRAYLANGAVFYQQLPARIMRLGTV